MKPWAGRIEPHGKRWRFRVGNGSKTTHRMSFPSMKEAEEARAAFLDRKATDPISHVYFVRSSNGTIKIGVSTDVMRRLASLQTANSARLTLLLIMPGTEEDEQELHRLFADERLRGEWFRPSRRLLRFIDECRQLAAHELVARFRRSIMEFGGAER